LLGGLLQWGTFNSNTARFRNGTVSPDRIYSNLIGEKLHTKFCKFILGVHKKTTNFAVLSELGRFSLYYVILKSIFHYWNRLEYLEKFCSKKPSLICLLRLFFEIFFPFN
jgi:hypothetical protein